ncbi:MAG: type IV secretion system DNA-binding domain-containing protein [Paraclostridium sp.]
MLKAKQYSIPMSKYFEIMKPQYVYLKLIPSSGIRNYNSAQLAALSNDICRGLVKRIRIEEKKLFYEAQTSVKYIIYQNKNEVAFYFIIAKCHQMMALEKISATWGNKVTVVPIELNEFPVLDDPTVYETKYKYEDALSVKTDCRTNTLLANILAGVDVLEEEDKIMVIFNMIPSKELSPKGWSVYHNDMLDRYKQGKSVYKNKFDRKHAFKFFVLFLFNLCDCLIETTKLLLNIKDEKQETSLSQLASNRKSLTNTTKSKSDTVIIDTQIVTLASSPDKRKEELFCKSVSSSFKIITENNEFISSKVKKTYNSSNDYIRNARYSNIALNKMSKEELQNGLCLPGDTILEAINIIEHKTIIDKPIKEHLTKGLVCSGTATSKAEEIPIFFPHDNKSNLGNLPVVLMSGMGAGKSNAVARYSADMINKEDSNVIVFDYNKNCELSRNIAYLCKPGTNFVNIDLSDFNTLEALANSENMITDDMSIPDLVENAQTQATSLVDFINALNPDFELTGAMEDIVFSAATLNYCFNGKSMKNIFSSIFNHEDRVRVINELDDSLKDMLSDDIEILKSIDERNREGVVVGTKDVEGIRTRIRNFRKNITIKQMLNKDPKDNLNFVDLLNQKNTLISIKLPEKKFRDDAIKDVIVGFYLSRIWNAIQIRSDQEHLNKVNIIIDEIHKLKTTTRSILPKLLVEARKFGARIVVCTHYLEQLGKALKPLLTSAHFMLLQGADTKNFKDLESKTDYTLDDFSNMKKYSAICLFKTIDGYSSIIVNLPPEIKLPANYTKEANERHREKKKSINNIKYSIEDIKLIEGALNYDYKQLLLPAPIEEDDEEPK